MERKLQATQMALEEERQTTKAFLNMAPQEGPALESWQNQMQIQWLQVRVHLHSASLGISFSIFPQSLCRFVGNRVLLASLRFRVLPDNINLFPD